jgi:hypothetical protein
MARLANNINGVELNALFVAISTGNTRVFEYLNQMDESLVFKGPKGYTGVSFAWINGRACFETVYATIMKHVKAAKRTDSMRRTKRALGVDLSNKAGLMEVFKVDIACLFLAHANQLLDRIFNDLHLDPLQYVLDQKDIQLNPIFIALKAKEFGNFDILSTNLTGDSDVFRSLFWTILELGDVPAFMHLCTREKYRSFMDLVNEQGETAVMYLVRIDNLPFLKALLDLGLNPNFLIPKGQSIVSIALHARAENCFPYLFSLFRHRGVFGHGSSIMEHLVLSISSFQARQRMEYLLIDFLLGPSVCANLSPAQLKSLQTMADAWCMELATARGNIELKHKLTLKYVGWFGSLLYRAGLGSLFERLVLKEFPVSLADVVTFQQNDYIGHSLLLSMLVVGDLRAFDSAFKAASVKTDSAFRSRMETLLHGVILENLVDGGLAAVQHLVQKHNATIDALDGKLETPLMKAVRLGNRPVVELLLEAGADAYRLTPGGQNILAIACGAGAKAMFDYLFERFRKDPRMPPLVLEDDGQSSGNESCF